MSLELIMNTNGTIDHASSSTISGGTINIITPASTISKAEGAGVYRGILNGTIAGANASGFVDGTVAGTWVMEPTATKDKSDLLPVIRLGDSADVIAFGTIDPTPPLPAPPTGPVPGGSVEVSDAGQTTGRGQ
jgi:hypothetical protein